MTGVQTCALPIWGTTFISTKILLADFQPVEILFFRFVIGFGALILACPHGMKGVDRRQEKVFALAGLCGICLYYLLENIALTCTLASNVGVIISAAPFFTAILSRLFMKSEGKLGPAFFIGNMKAVLRSLLCMLLILTAFVNTGCAKGADEDADYKVYYLNKENTKIVSSPYELQAKDTKEKGGSRKETEEVIEELLGQLSSDSEDVENKRPIPNGISVLDYTLEETLLTLYFSEAYSGLDRFSEVLTRAAVVRTMMQVNGVECIS